MIVGGDFNFCWNLSDRFPVSARPDKSVQYLVNFLNNCNLVDSWSTSNPRKPGYTYFDKKSNSYSRLDYILISQNTTFQTKNVKITQPVRNPGVVDHSAVKLLLKVGNSCKGPGYWKLNNSILYDQEYLIETKHIIEKTIQEYQQLKSYQLIWEMIKINIREFTIGYCKDKAAENVWEIQSIQEELDIICEKILNLEVKVKMTYTETTEFNNLQVKKSELESKQQHYYSLKQKGQYIRARVKWVKDGDVPSK